MELVVCIVCGVFVSSALGALIASFDRGTMMNAAIGAVGGAVLGALLFIPQVQVLTQIASENEVFLVSILLGASGGGLFSLAIGRAVSAFAN